jgi:hypothetical protein
LGDAQRHHRAEVAVFVRNEPSDHSGRARRLLKRLASAWIDSDDVPGDHRRVRARGVPTATNQGFIVVEPRREEDRYFLLHEMRRRVPEFMDRANGSTFMEISRRTFKSLSVEWPSESDRRELARKLEPLHRAAIELEREVAELESGRDELLPLLLAGRVRADEVAG